MTNTKPNLEKICWDFKYDQYQKNPSKRNVDGIWLRGLCDGSDSDDGDCDSDIVMVQYQ